MFRKLCFALLGTIFFLSACTTSRPHVIGSTKPSPSVNDNSLFGGTWNLIKAKVPNVNRDITPKGMIPTLKFGNDFTISGNNGCNTFKGAFSANGNDITIGKVASTRKMCDENSMAMEKAVTFALEKCDNFKIENNQLTLMMGNTVLAVYSR